jgi:hypothetical protein
MAGGLVSRLAGGVSERLTGRLRRGPNEGLAGGTVRGLSGGATGSQSWFYDGYARRLSGRLSGWTRHRLIGG